MLSEDGESYSISGYSGTDSNVVIPSIYNEKPVTRIGDGVFDSCYSITDVYYSGREEDWNKIEIDSDNIDFNEKEIHFSIK